MKLSRALIALATFFVFASLAQPVGAQSAACQPAYGNGQNCPQLENITVDKKVRNPQTGQFVDNLTIANPHYAVGVPIDYQITVKNTSKSVQKTVVVRDFFPQGIVFVSGPGQYDTTTNVLTFVIGEIQPNETQTYPIVAHSVAERLPANETITCAAGTTTNRVQVSLGNQVATDTAGICLEKAAIGGQDPTPAQTKGGLKVFPQVEAKSTPQTGPEAFFLAALIPGIASGLALRKKTATIR